MVDYIRSDLEAILFHIKIAEAHARGQKLYGPDPDGAGPLLPGLIPTYNLSWGLRTVDGSYNNLLPGREYWGASNQPFETHMDPSYRTFTLDMNGPAPGGVVTQSYAPSLADPDGPGPAGPGDIRDPALRTISNLIVDQTLNNPAAIMESMRRSGIEGDLLDIALTIQAANVAYQNLVKAAAPAEAIEDARSALDELLDDYQIELSGDNVVLPAVATDEGLSAPFNSWFTLFGQFFDHGLDLVNKGGSGTVFIPLQPDDPLYVVGSPTNFMVLTRATTTPGVDGVYGTADDVRPLNTTSPFVDQNQTYSSHPSHQVFLREYALTDDGPKATGQLIEGGNGGMANWGELKHYASTILGIQLLDSDVGKVPLLRTDPYGNFIPGANGFPQVITGIGPDGVPNTADDIVIEGDPTANDGQGISIASAIRTTSQFLADIAHFAAPNGAADSDNALGLDNGSATDVGTYDDELLDKHFIAGDGRVNENIGLVTVHHIFHAEHNHMVDHTKQVVLATNDPTFIAEWLVEGADQSNGVQAHEWNGERLFQAAKFGTEMQYQHLVFEEFARKIQPSIDPFLPPDSYDVEINPAIMAEFAHVVYRFGHSMLTETVDRFAADFAPDHIGLIEAFLNPVEFDANGTISDAIGAGDIVRGMTRQVGQHIDEFVTSALRDNLLGLPLDLATINLARGRDTGVPSLNAARREFYEVTGNNEALKPYASWVDFAANLKNEASIINFIAAYGTHTLITSESTLAGKRAAAIAIITGSDQDIPDNPLTVLDESRTIVAPDDAVDFLNAQGAYAGGKLGGLEDVDLWIGGLAERTMPFGGMLGSTFNFVFEVQLESLQNGDRFYYLQRNTGQHLFEQLEANSLATMIMRHTDATHLPGDVFSTPGLNLEVDPSRQYNDLDGDGDLEHGDPVGPGLVSNLVIRNDPSTAGYDTDYLRYTGDEHVVLGGTNNNDTLIAGIGDDTVHGDAGNDRIEGGFGNDEMRGGDGDDVMTDQGGDDVFKGGKGNDAIGGGSGIDLILAGDGNDFAVLGRDADGQMFGGLGNDFLLASPISLPSMGNEGDDWLEDGGNAGLFGDSLDDGFARDKIRGNDVMIGIGGGFDEYVGEGGDDIMVGSLGSAKHAGMSGFDWVTFKNVSVGLDASLLDDFIFDEAPTDPADISLQRFESVEGLSGTRYNDRLAGSDFTAADRIPGGPDHAFLGSFLDAQGIALINGLQAVVGNGVTFFSAGDIILGGDGNDEITGGGGDDIIDGDKWLNVRISVRANSDGTGIEIDSADSMSELTAEMFNGTYNPGQLVIVREIKSDTTNVTGDLMNIDTAAFSGNLAAYDIEGRNTDANGVQTSRARDVDGDGYITVTHARGTQLDGVDRLGHIEELRFADQTLVIAGPNLARVPVVDLHAYDLVTSMTANYADNFNVASFSNSSGTTAWTAPWVETNDSGGVTAGQIQLNAGGTEALRFVNGDGASITRALALDPTQPTVLSYTYSYSGLDTGDNLRVEFAANGVNFVTVQTIAGTVANNANLGPTTASIAVTGSATSAIRFTVSTLTDIEGVRIEDLSIVSGVTTQVAANDGIDFSTTYIEDNPAIAIALNPTIVDVDSPLLVSAQIRLTNAQPADLLSIAGTLPAGITAVFAPSPPGVITLNLSGSASPAAYMAALQAVRFSNTSLNPGSTARTIEVTVSDADGPSTAAVTTVEVVAINDAPVAIADAIVTNITSGNIVIPEWVLLANDSDPEGAVLDITAVSAAAGVTGLSLTANPGSVTFGEDGSAGGTFTYTVNDGAALDNTANGTVTMTNTGFTTLADNFNGANNATPSAANNSTGTTSWAASSWVEADDNANIRTGQVAIDGGAAPGTNVLRFGNGDGASITRGVNLAGVTNAALSLTFDKTGIDVGESVLVQFAADGINFTTLSTITNSAGSGANANGTLTNLVLPGTLGANSAIRFVSSAINDAAESILIDNVVISYGAANSDVVAGAGNQILVGNDAASSFTGGNGNDTVLAGGGNDIINWSVGNGRDFVDGGANGAAGDRFIVNGNGTVETFVVYARAEAIAAGVVVTNAATEIVITRNGIANVVAELDNIEEITINTGAGADTVTGVGNFGPTSLFFNTITVNPEGGRDTIDASQLTSAHRLVLNSEAAEDVAQQAVVSDYDGYGRGALRLMARMEKLDFGGIDFGAMAIGNHSVFASNSNGYRTPTYERQVAVDVVDTDFVQLPQYEHRAGHFDAVDYLII